MSSSIPRRAKVVWTYDDLQQMTDDRLRYEIIDGELYVTPSPTTTHQKAFHHDVGRKLNAPL